LTLFVRSFSPTWQKPDEQTAKTEIGPETELPTANVLKKRILVIGPTFGAWGGLEAFMMTVAKHCSEQKDFATRLCYKINGKAKIETNFSEQLRKNKGISSQIVRSGSAALWREIRQADIVHAQNASPDICTISAILQKPLFLTIHNHMHKRRGWRAVIWKIMARLGSVRWYNSNFVRGSWEHSKPSRHSHAFPTVSEIEFRQPKVQGRHGFLFLARWIENKGMDLLLEAYRSIAPDPVEWPLHMLGDGPLRQHLEDQYRDVPGIHFHGFVEPEVKHRLIRSAKWMVTPPHTQEDMGLTPLEARAMGIPCIVTRDGGLPEVAGEESLLCEPGSIDSLRNQMAAAIAMDENEYAIRSKQAYEGIQRELRPIKFYSETFRRA